MATKRCSPPVKETCAYHVDPLCLDRLGLLLLFDLEEKGAIDVGKDTAESDGGAD
jgi:hypothetical protein